MNINTCSTVINSEYCFTSFSVLKHTIKEDAAQIKDAHIIISLIRIIPYHYRIEK